MITPLEVASFVDMEPYLSDAIVVAAASLFTVTGVLVVGA